MTGSPEPDPRANIPSYNSRFFEGSELSDLSQLKPTPLGLSGFGGRPGYERLDSTNPFGDDAAEPDTFVSQQESSARGLGIAGGPSAQPAQGQNDPGIAARRQNSVPPVGVGRDMFSPRETIGASSSTSTPAFTPALGSGQPFLSPDSRSPDFNHGRAHSYYGNGMGMEGQDTGRKVHKSYPSVSSLRSSHYDPYLVREDDERMMDARSIRSTKSVFDAAFDPRVECPARHNLHQGCGNWLSITIYILSVYSTALSGLFFICAVAEPFWPRIRTAGGDLTPQNAIILTSVLAKTVELSFVTAFVACLGQILSRRAFNHDEGKGMTLAEMSMRNWIMQPGTMITHPASVRYGAISVLGVAAILATVMSTLYTSAASALVQPQLKLTDWNSRVIQGQVQTQWANVTYLASNCQTPIINDPGNPPNDPSSLAGSSCMQLEYAATSFHNYAQYLADWTTHNSATQKNSSRPLGSALYQNNVRVTTPWLPTPDIAATTEKYGFPVHNVTLAVPHAGVVHAAKYKANNILQPSDLDGQGLYYLHAAVPNLAVNVICAAVTEEQISPLVYTQWPFADKSTANLRDNWPNRLGTEPRNATDMDELFGWANFEVTRNETSGEIISTNLKQARPAFAKLPLQYNTLLNHTKDTTLYGRDRIYALLRVPDYLTNNETLYNICSMKPTLTDQCSTLWNSTSETAGALSAICDEDNSMAYHKAAYNKTMDAGFIASEWFNIASEWANSLSLNYGVSDGNGSNSRILTQLGLTEGKLSDRQPSVAEALAVMSSSTLLMSTQDATFLGLWNYSSIEKPRLAANEGGKPSIEYFNALLKEQQFASGVHTTDGKGFMVVLFTVFLLNVLIGIYFLFHWGFITDYSEPPNMFTIAINSPPSNKMMGSCGTGPEAKQWDVQWFLNHENDHMFLQHGDQKIQGGLRRRHRPSSFMEPGGHTPVSQLFQKFGKKKSWV